MTSDLLVGKRIAEIRALAAEEAIAISSRSESDLIEFLRSVTAARRPKLYLLDNGNVRAVWKGADDQQIGLQFLGDGQVQFVVFGYRHDPDGAVQACGRDTVVGIQKQIKALGVARLLLA